MLRYLFIAIFDPVPSAKNDADSTKCDIFVARPKPSCHFVPYEAKRGLLEPHLAFYLLRPGTQALFGQLRLIDVVDSQPAEPARFFRQ